MMFFFLEAEAEADDEAVDDFLLGRLLAKGSTPRLLILYLI